MRKSKLRIASIASAVAILIALSVSGQSFTFPSHREAYSLSSGVFRGAETEIDTTYLAFCDTIRIPDAPWLRVIFDDYFLGEKSYMIITSLEDGGHHRLNSITIDQWGGKSAYFNGDAVEIKLFVHPGDDGVFFAIADLLVGDRGTAPGGGSRSLCGGDDRVLSYDNAVGRFIGITGSDSTAAATGWITSTGCFLTAGHVITRVDPDLIEFSYPLSDPDGTPNFADPDSMYPVDWSTVEYRFTEYVDNRGNDWGFFGCFPNSNTGKRAVIAQNAYYRMSRDSNPDSIRITGNGDDDTPDTHYRVQQTDHGPYIGETYIANDTIYVEYIVDTENSSSGSPVIIKGTTLTIGIHTNAGCSPPTDGNKGTSFENDTLEYFIQRFHGPVVEYVDRYHPIGLENGTVFRPYNTVVEGTDDVTSGGIICITEGSYPASMGNTFTGSDALGADGKAMTLIAPVGTVTIGN